MRPFLLVAIVVAVFVFSMPAMYVFINGVPGSGKWNLPVSLADAEEGESDDPEVAMLCLKGVMYMGNEQYDKALAAYTEAIGRDPKCSMSYAGRGNVYFAKGDLDRALLDFDQASRLDPKNEALKVMADMVREQRARK
jgi:tetratricopeptide (TPR) repeat protein